MCGTVEQKRETHVKTARVAVKEEMKEVSADR